jgi:hypothetical protein
MTTLSPERRFFICSIAKARVLRGATADDGRAPREHGSAVAICASVGTGQHPGKESKSMRQRISTTLLTLTLGLGASAVASASEVGYAFVRTLEGTALLQAADVSSPGGPGDSSDERGVALNSPLWDGDRVSVSPGGRLEVVLPDGNVARLGGRSVVSWVSLAGGDSSDRTAVTLDDGELVWISADRTIGRDDPRVDLFNATVYLGAGGSYRIETDGRTWSSIVVRAGSAEILTPEGSTPLRAGDALEVRGWGAARRNAAAFALSDLESWGRRLDTDVRWADLDDVEPHLRYGAASLARHGGWVAIDGRRAWRPYRVASNWRPFLDGRWIYSPSGWTWVSSDPWGWTTSHYGSWDYVPGYGWAWFPGSVYSPAWVYWYWSSGTVGWCPYGYYSRYYQFASHRRSGIYGWGGGNGFNQWTFCPTRSFRSRSMRAYCGEGPTYFDRGFAPRGIITTDTRPVTRDLLGSSAALDAPVNALHHAVSRGDLPDVSDFVARRRSLPSRVSQAVEEPLAVSHSGREPWSFGPVVDRPGRGGSSSSAAGGFHGQPGASGDARPEPRPRNPAIEPRPRSEPRPYGDVGSSQASPDSPANNPVGGSASGEGPRRPRDPVEPYAVPSRPAPRPSREPASQASPPSQGDSSGREPARFDVPVRRVIDGTRRPTEPAQVAPPPADRPSTGSSSSSQGGREPAPAPRPRSSSTGSTSSGSPSSGNTGSSSSTGSNGSSRSQRGDQSSRDRGQNSNRGERGNDPPARPRSS